MTIALGKRSRTRSWSLSHVELFAMGPTSTNLRASSALIVQMLLVQVLFQAEECASQNPYTGFARHPLDDEDVGGIGVSRLGGVEVQVPFLMTQQ